MSSRKNTDIRNRRGSYVAEAAVTLPIFIICVLALTMVIGVLQVTENINFTAAKEIHGLDLLSAELGEGGAADIIPIYLKIRGCDSRLTDFSVTSFDYLYSRGGIDDLIALSFEANFKIANPIGVLGKIQLTEKILSRGFTGTRRPERGLEEGAFQEKEKSDPVVVFPHYGIRYHSENCAYVSMDYPGDEYHIEMELEDARRLGYTPCLVCRGGEDNG